MFFLTAGEVFLFRCCIKNLQCRSARFFRASSTDVSFRPKLACSDLFGQENISPPRQKKILFTDIDRKKWQSASARKDDRCLKRRSPDDANRTFPNQHHPIVIQGLNRINNGRCRSLYVPDWYLSAEIAQFLLQTLAIMFFLCFFFFTVEEVFYFGGS